MVRKHAEVAEKPARQRLQTRTPEDDERPANRPGWVERRRGSFRAVVVANGSVRTVHKAATREEAEVALATAKAAEDDEDVAPVDVADDESSRWCARVWRAYERRTRREGERRDDEERWPTWTAEDQREVDEWMERVVLVERRADVEKAEARSEVQVFAEAIEKQVDACQNDAEDGTYFLLRRLSEGVEKLRAATIDGGDVLGEAAKIAAAAMLVARGCGALGAAR